MKRILFVDDDPLDSRPLRDILKLFNSEIDVALVPNVGSALRFLCDKGPIDLVVTDQMMKSGSGDDLLRLIRSGETENAKPGTGRDVPVILLSGAADEYGGFTASILKPYDIREVFAVFEQILGIPIANPFKSG